MWTIFNLIDEPRSVGPFPPVGTRRHADTRAFTRADVGPCTRRHAWIHARTDLFVKVLQRRVAAHAHTYICVHIHPRTHTHAGEYYTHTRPHAHAHTNANTRSKSCLHTHIQAYRRIDASTHTQNARAPQEAKPERRAIFVGLQLARIERLQATGKGWAREGIGEKYMDIREKRQAERISRSIDYLSSSDRPSTSRGGRRYGSGLGKVLKIDRVVKNQAKLLITRQSYNEECDWQQ